jgi:protein-tyrosine phosphatase
VSPAPPPEGDSQRATGAVDRVLVVCTANRCRSPLAAAILRARLAARGVTAEVESVGLLEPGYRATDATVEAAAALGIDLGDHLSRRLDVTQIREADLIVGMERGHVREVVVFERDAWPRTFTLKELARRAADVGPRTRDEPLRGWLERVHEGRRSIELLGASADDDVADPTDTMIGDHDTTARELADLVDRVVELAWPGPQNS